jgi:hypothetical protein
MLKICFMIFLMLFLSRSLITSAQIRSPEESKEESLVLTDQESDSRYNEKSWETGTPPQGCYWECKLEAGCTQEHNETAQFQKESEGSVLPGQFMKGGIRNPWAAAYKVGSGPAKGPGGSYPFGAQIEFSVTIPQSVDGWERACYQSAE